MLEERRRGSGSRLQLLGSDTVLFVPAGKTKIIPFFLVTNLIRFSFLLVPRESNAVFGWLHHRVPVILADEAAVSTWLDPEMDSFEALDKIPEVSKDQVNLF